MDYCLGFAFSPSKQEVLLLKKARPDWQKGLYNGVGGKVEEGEHIYDAMVREFEEETGHRHEDWRNFITMSGSDWCVTCYKAIIALDTLVEICGNTREAEEPCSLFNPQHLDGTISNLSWLIPMSLDEISYNIQR